MICHKVSGQNEYRLCGVVRDRERRDIDLPLPTGTFSAILADPPWHFTTRSSKGRDRCPDARHYQTMTLDDIIDLPVGDLAADDCMLFLWVTDWLTPATQDQLLTAWGFTYKTVAFYWTKCKPSGAEHVGTGYYTRANPEQCLLATKGHPKRLSRSVRKWIHAPVREHSRKPDETYERIEQLVAGPYLELFSRTNRPGWTSWGDQSGMFGG